MKKLVLSASILALTVGLNSVTAQTTAELYNFSNQNQLGKTARVSAMAGAYTSLGADLSSLLINPAGLAMFTNSEVAITPSVVLNNNSNNFSGRNSTQQNNTKFIISNLAGVFYSNKGFTLAVGYNRLVDFSGSRLSYGTSQSSSVAQIYAQQLAGIEQSTIQTPESNVYQAFYNYDPNLWNAIMAYQTGLVNPLSEDKTEDQYTTGGLFNSGDSQTPQSYTKTSGSINELTIGGGYNYNDILYLGVTFGFQDMIYAQDYYYTEVYSPSNSGTLQDMTTRSYLRMSGTGFNMRFGATVRPNNWLRIGVAYHTPTWMRITESSYSDMTVYDSKYNNAAYSDTPDLVSDFAMHSPSKLLAGVSFAIARRVIVSADYERAWYNQMKMNTTMFNAGYRQSTNATAIDNMPNLADNYNYYNSSIDLNNIISEYYQPVNAYRVGIEAQPFNGVYIRAGYSYTTSPYRDVQSSVYMSNLSDYGAQTLYSGGLGYRNQKFGIDVTYTYCQTQNLPDTYYSYINNGTVIQADGYNFTTNDLSQIILTVSFKINHN